MYRCKDIFQEVIMKTLRRISAKAFIGLIILLLSGCNFPGGQEESLVQTVQALNTIVARNSAATQTPAPAHSQPLEADTQAPPADVPTATETVQFTATPIVHSLMPAQPGWVARWFTDTDSSRTANEKRAPGGDNIPKNIFERPFTATDMTFRPDLDINKAEISSDSSFIYITLYLNGINPQTSGLQGMYGVELDTDLDGRGNYLILASNPSGTEWKMENVTAYKDSGKKVGGARPMAADAPSGYVGYDQTIFSLQNLSDPDAAWGRVSPKGGAIVELAFKRSLVGGANQFLWGVWADDGVKDVAKFDYNDHFTANEAGSPYQDANYPLKALALVDNTCREVYNFTPTADIPGLCALPPTATPTPLPPTVTPTLPPSPGNITGLVFSDNNNNGNRDAGDGPWCTGVSVWYHPGSCSGAGFITSIPLDSSCNFSASSLPAGEYCVSASGYEFTTPTNVTVNVPAGGTANVQFGIYVVP
jgi:hypothetical protein